MKKKNKMLLGFLAVVGLATSLFVSDSSMNSEAETIDFGSTVRKHYENGRIPGVDPPSYITFRNGKYGGRPLWERLHENMFLWYSPIEPDHTKQNNTNTDYYQIIENRAERDNRDYWKLVDPSWNQNLKLGSIEPGYQSKDMYRGDNTGTTTLTGSKYTGKKYEWRYLGYGTTGQIIENPFFPPDYPVDTKDEWQPEKLNWEPKPWNNFTSPGPYDGEASWEQKVEWFKKYFFAQNPEFRRPGKSIDEDAAYWADRFTLHNNPEESTGIVTGWHTTRSGRTYYASFILKTPPQPNLRLIEYTVRDKETGKIIGQQTISASDNNDKDRNYPVAPGFVEAGKTYTITAKVKNMYVPGLGGSRDTKHQPIRLYQAYKIDEDISTYNYTYAPVETVYPTTPTTTIKYGGVVEFSKQSDGSEGESNPNPNSLLSWEFTVPPDAKKEVMFEAGIDYDFYLKNENTYDGDDFAELTFKIKPEDIGCDCNRAELIDSDGNVVNDVVPYQTYGLRLYVKKYVGNKKVGDPNDYYNPFASIDVAVTDKGKVTNHFERVATKDVLTKEGQVAVIEIPNAITPNTSIVEATWKLNGIHEWMGQSTILTNDGPCKYTWASNINISVSNFVIKPSSFMLPVGQSSTTETLSFDFDIMNSNVENQDKDIDVVIKKGGQEIWRDTVYVPANRVYTMPTVTVSGVNLSEGENAFTVEVNPPPRKWFEFKKDAVRPEEVYEDNIAHNSVMVHKNKPAKRCEILNNENTWITTHYLREWHGYRVYWTHCTDNGCHQHSYCVTTSDVSWTETISYYERYQITNVFFRSKLTKDKALRDGGGDGWVDLANGKPGEVKAGYGFEIKYVVKYQTNTYTASPKPWSGDCSGKTVNPRHGSYVDAPNTIQVTMPFNDKSGQPVIYDLTTSSESGRWDNLTQLYEMPYHNALNMKWTREVFINETAKDGDYQIRIDTFPFFYGSYDKPPTTKWLCDYKIVTIRIKGADSDDIKSHVTQ